MILALSFSSFRCALLHSPNPMEYHSDFRILISLSPSPSLSQFQDYKKAKLIKEMAVCSDKNLLILILMNGHYLCMDSSNLVEFTTKSSRVPMGKTKNAESICSQFRSPYYRFAIASKKNLYLFQWTTSNKQFICFREVSNGEPCISCLFYHQFVCYSTHKKGFIMHEVRSGNEKKINVPAMPNNIPLMSRISSHYDDDLSDYKVSKHHDDGYLLVQISTSPSLGIFVDHKGNPAQKDTVNWTSAPLMVIDCLQYMVGYLPTTNKLEVISLVDQKAVQQIELQKAIRSPSASTNSSNALSPSSHSLNTADFMKSHQSEEGMIGGLFRTASDHIVVFERDSVSLLVATPIKQQIAECIEHLRIEKGLKLLMKSNPTQNELRTFQAQSGFALFQNLQWKRAMEHFEISDVDPRDIIYLFPAIKFNGFEYSIQHPSAPQNVVIDELIDRVLSEKRALSNMTTPKQEFQDLKRAEYLNSIFYLGEFLWKRRSDPPSDDLQIRGAEMTLCVDTALLKIAVELEGGYTDNTMSLRSMRSVRDLTESQPFSIEQLLDADTENACVFAECEKLLISHQQYYHLALFYRSKKKIEKALNALHKIGESKEWHGDVEDAVNLTIDILSRLGDTKDLWTYSQWVLLKEPRTAMAIFTHSKRRRRQSDENVNERNPMFLEFDKVLGYLREDIMSSIDGYDELEHFDFIEFYLEFIARKSVNVESAANSKETVNLAKYHDELAYCYMAKIERLSSATKAAKAKGPGGRKSSGIKCAATKLEVVRRKLLEFLEESELVDNSELLRHAKKFKLYDEIIELNKKLRKHNDVLHTLVVDKRDHEEAIKYCMQTAPSSKDRSDRFLELLRLYFMSAQQHEEQMKEKEREMSMNGHTVSASMMMMDGEEEEDDDTLDLHRFDHFDGDEPVLTRHRKKSTVNLELLAQEINAENDEFAFMDSVPSSSATATSPMKFRDRNEIGGDPLGSGMGFDFEDEERPPESETANPLEIGTTPSNTRQRSHGVDQMGDLGLQSHTRQRSGVIGGDLDIENIETGPGRSGLGVVAENNSMDAERAHFFDRGCEILYEFAFEMDPLRVLQLLPAAMDVTFLAEYIRRIVPYVVHKRRIKAISKNLQKRVYLRQRTELAKVRSQFIKMDHSSVCAKCHKRIGSSVFILQPRTLHKFHYSCFYRKRQPRNPQLMTESTDDSQYAAVMRSDDDDDGDLDGADRMGYAQREEHHLYSTTTAAATTVSSQQESNEQSQLQSQIASNPFHAVPSTSININPFGSGNNVNAADNSNPFGNSMHHRNEFDPPTDRNGSNPFSSNNLSSATTLSAAANVNVGSTNPFQGNNNAPSSSSSSSLGHHNPFGNQHGGGGDGGNASNLNRNNRNPFQSENLNLHQNNPFL